MFIVSTIRIIDTPGFYAVYDGVVSTCEYADSKQISKNRYELQQHLWYMDRLGNVFRINKGFIHDGASKGMLKHFGKFTNAAILHDALFRSHAVPLKRANSLFLEAMEISNVKPLRRKTYYAAVYLFGWYWYDTMDVSDVDETCLISYPKLKSNKIEAPVDYVK